MNFQIVGFFENLISPFRSATNRDLMHVFSPIVCSVVD